MVSLRITGDPFIDAGSMAAEAIFDKLGLKEATKENWLKVIDWAATIYQDKWGSAIDAISLNGVVTHNQKRKRARKEAITFYQKIFSNQNPYKWPAIRGWCRGCGSHELLFGGGRDILPLSGSGAFLNFHHAHENGLFLCKHCVASLFFVPFSVLQCGKNIALLQTRTKPLREFWKKNTVMQNLGDIAVGKSQGILRSPYNNVKNALFGLVNNLITEWHSAKKEFVAEDLRLFYFTNFGANPECEIYDLPADVFHFLWIVSDPAVPHVYDAWKTFVRRNYRIRDADFDEDTRSWKKSKGKSKSELSEKDYLNSPNFVYQRLLSGKNILSLMYVQRQRKTLVPIEIPKAYLLEVRHMKKERIDAVLLLADRICEIIRAEKAPKLLYPIESARVVYEFRAGLLKLFKKNMQLGNEEPLFTTEDYLYKLLPDGEPWSDVRDLLLIRIYEKLHDELRTQPEAVSEESIEVPIEAVDDEL